MVSGYTRSLGISRLNTLVFAIDQIEYDNILEMESATIVKQGLPVFSHLIKQMSAVEESPVSEVLRVDMTYTNGGFTLSGNANFLELTWEGAKNAAEVRDIQDEVMDLVLGQEENEEEDD